MATKNILLAVFAIAMLFALVQGAHASGFPVDYPGNQYGMESSYYSGPWGERMVYGSYGYFPNWNGYAPYGYRTYGYFYTPWDLRYGTTSRFVTGSGYGGSYGSGYGGYGGGYGGGFGSYRMRPY